MVFPRLTSSSTTNTVWTHPLYSLIWCDIITILWVSYNANPTQSDQLGRGILYLETVKGLDKLLKGAYILALRELLPEHKLDGVLCEKSSPTV